MDDLIDKDAEFIMAPYVWVEQIRRDLEAGAWKVIAEAREVRRTGGASAELQLQHAMFLASEQSNHISGKLIHITDDWQKLRNATLRADALTLRRVQK